MNGTTANVDRVDEVPSADRWARLEWRQTRNGGLWLGIGPHKFFVMPHKSKPGRWTANAGGAFVRGSFDSAEDAQAALYKFLVDRGTLRTEPAERFDASRREDRREDQSAPQSEVAAAIRELAGSIRELSRAVSVSHKA